MQTTFKFATTQLLNYTKIVFVSTVLCAIQIKSSAQLTGGSAAAYVNIQLRTMFSNLNHPSPPVFYDQAAHFIDTSWYSYTNTDTINTATWSILYDELWWGHHDTNAFERADSVFSRAHAFGSDTVVVPIIDYQFYKLKDSVFGDTTYFLVDTNGPVIIDNPFRQSEPYRYGNVLSTACIPEVNANPEIVYRIDPSFMFIDPALESLYRKGDIKLEINFHDGGGWHVVDITNLAHYSVNYVAGYEHAVEVRRTVPSDPSLNGGAVARVAVPPYFTEVDPNETWVFPDDFSVDVYPSCDVQGSGQPEKFVIFVPGFDFVEMPFNKSKYRKFFEKAGLGDLRNHGYTVLIVNWKRSQDPTIDNAMRLVNLIDYLKCNKLDQNSDPQHQFVIIGSSSGGLITRYALAWMEQNPNFSPCYTANVHNTRLFISLDAEHQGAYVPLALQLFYAKLGGAFNIGWPAAIRSNLVGMNNTLQSPSARELLLAHYTQNNSGNYGITPERQLLLDEFDNLGNGGYPRNVKMVAIANGLMTGERQTGIYDECITQPNDTYLDYHQELKMTVLGQELLANITDLELRAIENGQNFFTASKEEWRWKLKLNIVLTTVRCFGPFSWPCIVLPFPILELEYENTLNESIELSTNDMIEWDVMPGSILGADLPTNIFPSSENDYMTRAFLGFETSLDSPVGSSTGTACPSYSLTDTPLGLFDRSMSTQTLGFCFVPTMSAFDYQDNRDPELNIFNEGAATIMANTPFDVVIGEVNGLPGYPQQQTIAPWLPSTKPGTIAYPSMNRMHSSLINHLMPDTFMVNDQNGTLLARYLNREIGDEEMLIDNYRAKGSVIMQAEYDITAGVNTNPLYEYVGQGAQDVFRSYTNMDWPTQTNLYGYNLMNNGIFARSEPFTIEANSNAELRSENFPIDNGSNANFPPFGGLNLVAIPQWVCVEEFVDLEGFNKRQEDETVNLINEISVYPNPTKSGSILNLVGLEKGNYSFEMFDLNGRSVLPMNEVLLETNQSIRLELPLSLKSGLYIVKAQSDRSSKTFKVSIL